MEAYLNEYSFHFNKRLYLFAVSMMRDRNGSKLEPWSKEKVDEFLRTNGVNLKDNVGYDPAYVLSMASADYFGSSIMDDKHLALFVKDFIEDIDGSDTKAFDHFYIDCIGKGIPIFWDDML